MPRISERPGGQDAVAVEQRPDEADRMRLQRERQRAVVVDDGFAGRHRRQVGVGFLTMATYTSLYEQRQLFGAVGPPQAAYGPERVAAVEAERIEGIGFSEPFEHRNGEPGAQPEVPDRVVAFAAAGDDEVGVVLPEADDLGEAEPDSLLCHDVATHLGVTFPDALAGRRAVLEHVPPVGIVNVGRPYLDAVLDRVADDLRGRIKAHGLAVE